MPLGKENVSSDARSDEPENAMEPEEKVDFDEENDPEEIMEEIEYEVEEEEEEEVEDIEEQVEEDANNANVDAMQSSIAEGKVKDEDGKKKHDELLSLPPHGSEVYIGGIPHDVSQEDLKVFCESIGEVTEVRVIKGKNSSENKGFAFVTFRSVELASKATDELNNTEFKGRKIKCSTSQAKYRLFIGNVPRSWRKDDMRKVVTEVGPGVTALELVMDVKNTNNNRGFAFIEYYNNACAEYSRQKMMDPKFKLGENAPTVNWADPKNADSAASLQVKAIYVKNLPKNVTQDQLKKLFEHHGKITRVVLLPTKYGQKNRIGFVHFAERSNAMKTLKSNEKYVLDGQVLECSLAKPQVEQKSGALNSQKPGLLPSYPAPAGYGLIGSVYGGVGAGAGAGAAGFTQPVIYGGGPTPSGMAMMPMLLPDGRIGYVLQQPGRYPQALPPAQQRDVRSDNGSGSRSIGSSSRRHSNDGGQGRRYHPY